MAKNLVCPETSVLRQLASAELPADEVEPLLDHLRDCAACLAKLQTVSPNDTLSESIAKAHTLANEPDDPLLTELIPQLAKLRPVGGQTAALPPAPATDHSDVLTAGPQATKSGQSGVVAATGQADATQAYEPAGDVERIDFLAPPQQPDELGRLGQYRILEKLGAGGMGMVFLAEDALLQRKVALKVMLPTIAARVSAKDRFLREARSAASIEHEHIVPIFQVGEDNQVPFLAMPLLKGEPLDARIDRDGKLPLDESLRIAQEMAEGLAAAHQAGLVHRDIKPGNVWLEGKHGKVKLLDFGLARAQDDNLKLTNAGALVGTPAYMAPEQARGGKVDARADLFSLGCVLYQMLTGQRPFKGESTMNVLTALALETPMPPVICNTELPDTVSQFTMRLLEKKPEDRPASAGEVAAELSALRRGTAASGREPTATAGPAAKRKRGLYVAAAACLLVLVGGGYWLAQVVIVRDKDGNKIVEVQVPKGGKVEVVPDAKQGDSKPAALDGQAKYALSFGEKDRVWAPSLKLDQSRPLTMEGYVTQLADDKQSWNPFMGSYAGVWLSGGKTWGLNVHLDKKILSAASVIPVQTGKRTHIAGVLTGRRLMLFVDGELAVSQDYEPLTGLHTFWLGCDGNGGCMGRIEEVRVSSCARYDKNFTPAKRFEPDADTLALYHFDEGQGAILKDSSGNGHHGQITGAKWVNADGSPLSPPALQAQCALHFDGKSSVRVGGLIVDYSRPCTFEGYATVRGGGHPFLCDGGGGVRPNANRWCMNFWADDPSGKRQFTEVQSTAATIIGKKTNLALVFTGRQFRLYVDGKLSAQKDLGDLSLKKIKLPFMLSLGFTGEISEVRVSTVARYDKDFTPPLRYDTDADTVGLYHFDEGQGEVLKDSSGQQNHGQIDGATWVKPDGRPLNTPAHSAPPQYALQFATYGTVWSSVQIPSLVVDFSRPCTLEGYATARGQVGWAFLCNGGAGVGGYGHQVWTLQFYGDDPNGKRKAVYEFGTFRLANGKRTHLALVFTGRQFRLYVDGNLSAKKDLGDLSLEKIKLPFTLGYQFAGEIFEARVSKVARYDNDFTPQPRFEPDADTLALYHFDEGQGEVLYDSSGNGHHGKIVGGKWVKLDEVAAFDAWVKDVAKMPAEKQVEAVAAKLKERNPGFDGKVTHKIDMDVVTSLEFLTDNVLDISPVRALAGLQSLDCSGSVTSKGKLGRKFFDLSPLNGMNLTRLNCNRTKVADLSPLKDMKLATLGCAHTQVSDLSPLKGMPLTLLVCGDTKVSDLSPLKDMPLTGLHLQGVPVFDLSPLKGTPIKEIHLTFDRKRDAEILRSIKTLEIINGKPAAEFWKEVEAGAKPIP
jgi:tRNA A-37 threonylcarbamoyl transferase component Bud32